MLQERWQFESQLSDVYFSAFGASHHNDGNNTDQTRIVKRLECVSAHDFKDIVSHGIKGYEKVRCVFPQNQINQKTHEKHIKNTSKTH